MGMGISVILLAGACLFLAFFVIVAVGLVYYLEQGRGKRNDH